LTCRAGLEGADPMVSVCDKWYGGYRWRGGSLCNDFAECRRRVKRHVPILVDHTMRGNEIGAVRGTARSDPNPVI
jgi:hypothetical protein